MNSFDLSPIISDGMIIQRDAAFPVWSSQKLTVTFLGKTFSSQNIDDKWLLTLDPSPAGGPFEMKITSDKGSELIRDIYIGDIWLCSGQSNMELPMQRLRDKYSDEWDLFKRDKQKTNSDTMLLTPNSQLPIIRQFKVLQEYDFTSPRENLTGGDWVTVSAGTLDQFSGTAWFFAKEMYKKYGIPLGLLNASWGGTPVESWMSADALASFPEKISQAKQYADSDTRDIIARNTGSAILEWDSNIFRIDAGIADNWHNTKTDISEWNEITLPCDFSAANLSQFCGVIWLAKEFEIKNNLDFAKVLLGTIVDSDTVYINGIEIGNTCYRYPPRIYPCDNLLKKGKNRIVIRVTCFNGDGGITKDKPFRIISSLQDADNESIELSGVWKYKIGAVAGVRPPEFFFQRQATGNYNAMIAPLLKFPMKGVIWYQGESNDKNPHEYSELFKKMILDWRKTYDKEQRILSKEPGTENNERITFSCEKKLEKNFLLTFLFVQLPIFGSMTETYEEASWAVLREAQASALSLPLTGMAAALEAGEWNDIHPLNKKDIGYRLFLAADKILFGTDNTSPGPVVREKRTGNNGQKIFIYFDNCGSGLVINSLITNSYGFSETGMKDTAHVTVIGSEGQARLPVKIEGNDAVSIDISSVPNPKKILYAWADNPCDRHLFNSEGLPVIPFRIEI